MGVNGATLIDIEGSKNVINFVASIGDALANGLSDSL
tara:strand:- start:213 stop:323 length:111 start_codon:yes stop_codon:yes gene_type:complete